MTKFKEYLQQQGFAKTTIRNYTKVVKEYQQAPHTQSTYNDLLEYIREQQQKHLTQAAIQNKINALKHYFEHEKREGNRKDNPAKYIQLKGHKKHTINHYLQEEELKQLYTTNALPIKDQTALGLLIFQGLTTNELKALYTTDIYLYQGTIQIPATKRAQSRILPLEAIQILDLAKYLEPKGEEPLYPVNCKNLVYEITKKISQQQKINSTLLRTSRILYWLKHHNLIEVQYRTGFKYLSSLEKYRQMETEGLREELEKYFEI